MPSHPLSFTIPFLYFLCSGACPFLGLRLPEGSWPCYKSERTTRDLGFWGTTLGSPLVLRTRAETWVFPHNPRPLVFFLLHTPHFSSLCSLSCLKPKVLPKGILFSACDWWKAVNCGLISVVPSNAGWSYQTRPSSEDEKSASKAHFC